MSAFTPSPWHIEYHGMGADGVPIIDITGPHDAEGYADNLARLVVQNSSGSITPEIARANARLMAAAPELLRELKVLHRAYCFAIGCKARQHQVALDALAAIRAAEGDE